MNNIIRIIKKPTSIILITLAVVAGLALKLNIKDWTPNIVTSAFEIFLTVFIVDRVLKAADARKFSHEQASKLTIFSEILNQYFVLHLRSVLLMTTSIDNEDADWNLNKINFQSLSNMYNTINLQRIGPRFQMPYEQYFETKTTLLSYLRKSLLELNPVVYNDITTLLSQYLVKSDEHNNNLRNCVAAQLKMTAGGKPAWEMDVEFIKSHTGPIEFPEMANAKDTYIQIWKDILETIATYEQFLQLVDKHKITINNR